MKSEQLPVGSLELIRRWQEEGDQGALAEFVGRYLERLTNLVRARMSKKLARRVDAEDVALSACRSFCMRIQDGRLIIEDIQNPRNLLAQIAIRKLSKKWRWHTAEKRSMDREDSVGKADSVAEWARDIADAEPTPEEAAAVTEEVERLLAALDDRRRAIVLCLLDGNTVKETAEKTGYSERMVGKVLSEFRTRLRERLP